MFNDKTYASIARYGYRHMFTLAFLVLFITSWKDISTMLAAAKTIDEVQTSAIIALILVLMPLFGNMLDSLKGDVQ